MSGEYNTTFSSQGLLPCNTRQCCSRIPMSWRTLLSSSCWRWRERGRPKHWYPTM